MPVQTGENFLYGFKAAPAGAARAAGPGPGLPARRRRLCFAAASSVPARRAARA
jgi:hypothetical protein